MIGLTISAAFQFHFMALAIDFFDRRGPSSKMHIHKTEFFSFKSGCFVQVENG